METLQALVIAAVGLALIFALNGKWRAAPPPARRGNAARHVRLPAPYDPMHALEVQIQAYVRRGYHVAHRDAYAVQMVRTKRFSLFWGLAWFLLFGVGLLVYVLYYMSKRDEHIYLAVPSPQYAPPPPYYPYAYPTPPELYDPYGGRQIAIESTAREIVEREGRPPGMPPGWRPQ